MQDFFHSYGFQLSIWALLAFSAIGVLVLYFTVRRREVGIELGYTFQELVKLCHQKSEEQRQLERQVKDLNERRVERDRLQAEESRARQWLASQEGIVREIRQQNDQLNALRSKHHEYEQCAALHSKLKSEEHALQHEVQRLCQERDVRNGEVKHASDLYLTLSQEVDQRKEQVEQQRTLAAQIHRQQSELKEAAEEYLRISHLLEQRRSEIDSIDTELEQLQARAERFKIENPYLADHQERIAQQWSKLAGQYQDVVHRNKEQWESLEEQFKRLRDQAQRTTSSLSL